MEKQPKPVASSLGGEPADLRVLVPLLKLATPVSLALLGGLFMQVVDTMFVGRLGAASIGGVSVGNAMFATFMILGLGISLGIDYLISRAFGARKIDLCNTYLIQALYLATGMSLLLGAMMWVGSLAFPCFGLDPEVARLGQVYLRTLCWSLLPFLLFQVIRQYLQAMGVVMPALVILVVANVVNACGNSVFVFGHLGAPAFGVAGSAMATFFSRVFMLVAIVVYTLRRDARLGLGLRATSRRFEKARLFEIVRLGFPSAMQLLFEVGVFATSTMLAGRLGAVPLAAHQIVLHLASLTFMIPLGVSSATAVTVGRALGAGDRERAVRAGWTAIASGATFAVVMGTLMFLLAGPLLGLFTTDPAVIQVGTSLLLVAALFQVSDAMQVIGTGALRGMGNTRISMYMNLVGHWALGLPFGYILCFRSGWGARGLWTGLSIGLTTVALALVLAWWQISMPLKENT